LPCPQTSRGSLPRERPVATPDLGLQKDSLASPRRTEVLRAMKISTALSALSLASLAAAGAPAQSQDGPPAWAYPVNPPNFQRAPDDGTIRRVPDSAAGFTLTQVRDLFAAPDWHPEEHPPMPEIVATGRKPDVFAFVTGQTDRAALRMPACLASPRNTSYSKRWSSRRACARTRCLASPTT
jgi:hypothetical protein